MTAKCRTCGARIVWRNHIQSLNPAPIDAEPAANGNIQLLDSELYRIVPKPERAGLAGTLHLNHWATCTKPPKL